MPQFSYSTPGEKVNVGWEDWYPKCVYPLPPAPLSEQVADLEKRKAQVEKELADLKAKRDAEEAAKAKAQTYGEKVAEGLVAHAFYSDCTSVGGYGFRFNGSHVNVAAAESGARRHIAAALDKAHADGRAEQREKGATMLERVAAFGYPFDDGKSYSSGRGDAYRAAARIIRDNK